MGNSSTSTSLGDDFVLTGDVDASDTSSWNGGFEPIGNFSVAFDGTFDGAGYAVTGLRIDGSSASDPQGLFSTMNGTVANVEFQNVDIEGAEFNPAGGIIGIIDDDGSLRNASVSGTVDGFSSLGGLTGRNEGDVANSSSSVDVNSSGDGFDSVAGGAIGRNAGGTVTDTAASGDVVGQQSAVGGLVGRNPAGGVIRNGTATGTVDGSGTNRVGGLVGTTKGEVINSSANATVTGDSLVGGLAGKSNGQIRRSTASGSVSGSYRVGGLVGRVTTGNGGVVANSSANATVDGSTDVGGLVGSNIGTVENTSANGTVNGSENVGGLVGANGEDVYESYATGTVNGSDKVGGLVGYNEGGGYVEASYATASVDGVTQVGGFVGRLEEGLAYDDLDEAYAVGSVDGSSSVGGFAGNVTGNPQASDTYWDTETTGQSTSDGDATGLTTDQLKGNTGLGFDFTNTWDVIGNGSYHSYPFLRSNTQQPEPGLQEIVLYAGGDGSASNPYQISDWEELNNTRINPGANFTLLNDLNSSTVGYSSVASPSANSGNGFVPIGEVGNSFNGTFDGDGHTISDLYIDRESSTYVGLFGLVSGSEVFINNTYLESVDITGDEFVGGLSGRFFDAGGPVNNVSVTGTVSGSNDVGGLAGEIDSIEVNNSYANVTVTGTGERIGGLVGKVEGATVTNSSTTGTVSNGFSDDADDLGGLVGRNNEGLVSSSYSNVTVDDNGGSSVGGLVGYNNEGTINTSYATGNVTGDNTVGGLVGTNYADNSGFASGTSFVNTSYATGKVSGNTNVGGLVGYNWYTVNASYWDIQTTGQSNYAGNEFDAEATNDTAGLTSAEMTGSRASTNMGDLDFAATWQTIPDTSSNGVVVSYPVLTTNTQSPSPRTTLYADGDGTTGNEYEIANWYHLNNVRENLDAEFELTADLGPNTAGYDAVANGSANGGDGFVPLGNSSTPLTGTFDGNGHTVSNLTISRSSENDVGLFGYVDTSGAVTTITLENVSVGGNDDTGGLVGQNWGTVRNVTVDGAITDSGQGGGLVVGENRGTVVDSAASGTVSGSTELGVLVGTNWDGAINRSYSTGTISSGSRLGGLVGAHTGSSALINESYSTADVSGSTEVGGLVGDLYLDATIEQSYAAGNVVGSGGLVGANDGSGTVSDSYWDVNTTGQQTSNGGTGLTTDQLKANTSLGGFDFTTTWAVVDNSTYVSYPYLQNNTQQPEPGLADIVPPTISNVNLSASSGDVNVTFDSDERLGTSASDLTVTVDGPNGKTYTFDRTDFSESGAGPYTYNLTATQAYDDGSGTYEANVTVARDADGNNGGTTGAGSGLTDTITLDLTPPSISNVSLSASSGEMDVTFDSNETLGGDTGDLTVTVDGPNGATYTFDRTDFAESGAGPYAYTLTTTQAYADGSGTYGANVTVARDADGNNGGTTGDGSGLTDSYDYNEFAGGDGTAASPYQIGNWTHLNKTRNNPDSAFVLINDLDESTDGYDSVASATADGGSGFVPIGDSGTPFEGTFDGNGHVIADLTIDRPGENYVGLFGEVGPSGSVTDVALEDANVTGGDGVGVLAGQMDGSVSGSSTGGIVDGNDAVGGLAGVTGAGSVTDSNASARVTGNLAVGGLVGYQNGGTTMDSQATGDVDGTNWVGGLVGRQEAGDTTGSYATGDVDGTDRVGGLVGYQLGTNVSESFATGNVSGAGNDAGGLVGALESGTISDAYATGPVDGGDGVGGLVGELDQSGSSDATVDGAYAIGPVDGSSGIGGLVGQNANPGFVTGGYWNTETSGQSSSDGGTGLTTNQLKANTSLSGFDFTDTWSVVDNSSFISYPYLLNNTQSPKPGVVSPKPPTVSVFSLSNPSGKTLGLTLRTDKPLANIEVSITGSESATLTTGDFTETDNGGSYTYEATYSASSEGEYTATLETATDAAGDDGASGQSDSVIVDTKVPTVSLFSASNPSGQDIALTFQSNESLSVINVGLDGPETVILAGSFDVNVVDGTYIYFTTYRVSTDGEYTATLQTAKDAGGNDGASGQSDTVTVDATDPTFEPEIVDTNSPVVEGERLNLTLRVTNTGNEAGTQTVTATVGPETQEWQISLDPGQQTTRTFTWQTGSGDAGNYTAEVSTDTASSPAQKEVQVTSPTVETLSLSLDDATLTAGESTDASVTAEFSDGSTADVTDGAALTVANTTVASLDNGTLTAQAAGNTSVTASYAGQQSTAEVTVSEPAVPPTLQSAVVEDEKPERVVLEFDRPVALTAGEPTTGFILTSDGSPVALADATAAGETVDLALAEPVESGQNLSVGYDGSQNLQSQSGAVADAFEQPVTNNLEAELPDEIAVTEYSVAPTMALVDYETVVVEATVANGLSEQATTTVPLRINGTTVDEHDVTLAAGETTTITFERTFTETGDASVTVGEQEPTTVEVVTMDVGGGEDEEDGTAPAQDLDGDGLREDVDGDGTFDLDDVHLLFEHRNDPLVVQYGELFDFDDDGTPVTLSDIEALYEKYGQTGSESTGVASETGERQTVIT